MKYSVAVKFFAIILCAAMLFGALASGFAIFCLNEAGLYRQPFHQAYAHYREGILQQTAQSIVQRYAAEALGGMDAQMSNAYFGSGWHLNSFRFGTMGYVLRDEEGKEVQTYSQTGEHPGSEVFTVAVASVSYPRMVAVGPAQVVEVPATEPQPESTLMEEALVYDAIPPEGAVVTNVTVSYSDSSEGVGSPDGLGILFHNAEGFAEFHGNSGDLLDVSRRSEIISLRFENEVLGVLYEITDPGGVGLVWAEADGKVRYLSNISNPDFVQNREDAPETTPFLVVPGGVGASIYDAPSETANVIGTLGAEDGAESFREYEVNGETWYLFAKGWVKAESADPLPDAAPAAGLSLPITVVLPRDTAVYAVPKQEVLPLQTLKAGMELEITRTVSVEGENWCLVPQGWIREAALNAFSEEAQETAQSTEESEPVETALAATEAVQTIPEQTVPEPMTAGPVAEETMAAQSRAMHPGSEYMTYYDGAMGQELVLEYTMEETGGYEVQFTLAENALEDDYVWSLLGFAYNIRTYLVPLLLGCILVFALLAVYLCCAAGHRPGVQEIRAGGLNRLPLDGWLILWLTGLTAAALLGVEGGEYLMRNSMAVGTLFAAALIFGGCVLTVCFFFACAAQFKTPGGFWWKNSLCGLLLRGVKICWGWLKVAFGWGKRMLQRYGFPYTRRLIIALWKFTRVLAVMAWDTLTHLWLWTRKQCSRFWSAFLVFWQQLPMTWQWLLAGFAMIILLALTVSTRFSFWGICGAIALILYAAHAFGTLLGGVKRMNKGDLNNKVDDKLLIGCFREFAGELNGLADVAVVAAQKQLKSERMKTELITNVSHDIKTPLTSIINYVDLLEKPHTPQEQAAYLEVLNRQSQRLKKLVDDLMEMSKASTGNMSVDIATVDAVEAVNQALGEFADKLDRAQLIPVFRHSEETICMQADGRLVWRVLSNLLGNAVKYALPGTRIYLDLNRVEDQVILSLKNISRQELNITAEELLERFVRGDVSRNTEGSGLGLNIARSLMELQKGSLQLLVDGDLFKVTLIFPAER